MSSLIQKFREINQNTSDRYTTISVRPTLEIAALIEAISLLTNQPVQGLLTEDLSEILAKYLLDDDRNAQLIAQIIDEHPEFYSRDGQRFYGESALSLLLAQGVIQPSPIDLGL